MNFSFSETNTKIVFSEQRTWKEANQENKKKTTFDICENRALFKKPFVATDDLNPKRSF